MDHIHDYYNSSKEETRLTADRAHQLEAEVTKHFILEYLSEHHLTADIGAGTGIYSVLLAQKSEGVLAVDPIPRHLELIRKEKVSLELHNLELYEGKASDLSFIADNTVDLLLCLGPYYHLSVQKERLMALNECHRILRPGGILFLAYINQENALSYSLSKGIRFTDEEIEAIQSNDHGILHTADQFTNTSYFSKPSDVIHELKDQHFDPLRHIAQDNLKNLDDPQIKDLSEESWQNRIQEHIKQSETIKNLNQAIHGLIIASKNEVF